MLNFIWQWILYLNEPIHVANIQRYFGLERKDSLIKDSTQQPPSSNGHSTPNPEKELATSSSDGESSDSELTPQNYVIHNYYWYWLFKFGTTLGEEIFYASVFPFWFWNIDGAVGRRIINVWSLSMFIGQSLKDIICWPRPQCPPVIRMENKWALEYGMPSTHAMVSVTVPFSVILLTANRYEYPVYIGVAIAFTWCILVSTSRLYLGMHSVADILGGLALASLLLPVLLPLVDTLDAFLLTHPAAPGLLVTTTITLMLVYPGSKFSSAKEDTAVILGSSMGLQLGGWISFQMGWIRGPPIKPPYSIIWPSYEMLGLSLLRTIIGLITVVATRAIAKSVSYAAMKGVVSTLRSKDKLAKEDARDVELFVKLGVKLMTYAAIGIDVVCLAPAAFRFLNIERPTFHTEI
ncbi:sphingosine-1-phosphate phosphatase 2-like [Daphnia pulex]|uniref:sphingosine-1-phosphate phosphatase 2-like n=1 Tax=Daphnia pulex TaxID=6669 RepID=UPI001EDF6858|nr:sphingosine-1-phosphate phosphatase 2-like [Daphnia pulex]XP_046649064.1 sphingosine-1-phosphate phosphatase 2-like [Daphnia pulicaria]